MDNPELSKIGKAIRTEDEGYVDYAAKTLRMKAAANNGLFSETVLIKPNGFLDLTDKNGDLKSYFAHLANAGENESVEELYKLAYRVQQKAPELVFTFERDNEGQSITYTVRESSSE